VRGKGLDAVRLAGVVLGSFRDAAQDRADLRQVAAALDRSVTRAIGPEDFVTAVLVQVARGAFFPLQTAAAFALVSADLEVGLESLWAELQRHVAGQLHDDVALLLIEHST
jgi:hypothetical protein